MEPKGVLTVTQLNLYLKALLDTNRILSRVFVRGEISNYHLHASGHIYLSLKDEGGLIRAVCFRSAAAKLKFRPENGQKVIARGRVSLFERDGQIQLYIDGMQPEGLGSLYLAFEQLKDKLQREGLFDAARKKPIPRLPGRIGLVTAPGGAAVRDMLHILNRRFPQAQVRLYPVLVQGEQAPGEIVEGLTYFNRTRSADLLIVGRGGGSIEDLWAFNDEGVARAIAGSRIPVISAVGHETDFTIADFVADLRAPTPSAAAELAVPDQNELRQELLMLRARLGGAMAGEITRRRESLNRIRLKDPKTILEERRSLLVYLQSALDDRLRLILTRKRSSFSALAAKLDALSPLKVLGRGYAVAADREGRVIRSVEQVKEKEEIRVLVADGEIFSTVTGINRRKP